MKLTQGSAEAISNLSLDQIEAAIEAAQTWLEADDAEDRRESREEFEGALDDAIGQIVDAAQAFKVKIEAQRRAGL